MMSVSSPKHYARLADCATHYIAVERGGKSSWKCPYCRVKAAEAKLDKARGLQKHSCISAADTGIHRKPIYYVRAEELKDALE